VRTPRYFAFIVVTVLVGTLTVRSVAAMFGLRVFSSFFMIGLSLFAVGMIFCKHKARILRVRKWTLCASACIGITGMLYMYNTIYINQWYEEAAEVFGILLSTVPLYVLFLSIVCKWRGPRLS